MKIEVPELVFGVMLTEAQQKKIEEQKLKDLKAKKIIYFKQLIVPFKKYFSKIQINLGFYEEKISRHKGKAVADSNTSQRIWNYSREPQ